LVELLMLGVVGSLRLCLLVIGAGGLSGVVGTLVVFGQVHLFTLVIGASLIGVSIDYAFHYFAEQLFRESGWSPVVGLSRILPGSFLGLVTSVLAYLGLLLAPFVVLQQLAVFSAVGLVFAFLSVVCCFPLLSRSFPVRSDFLVGRCVDFVFGIGRRFSGWQRVGCLGLFLAVVVFGLSGVAFDDDVRALQHLPEDLVAEQEVIQSVLKHARENQFFVVSGESLEDLLQTEERLVGRLSEFVDDGQLGGFQALSSVLPSRSRQEASFELVREGLYEPYLKGFLSEVGFSGAQVSEVVDAQFNGQFEALSFDDLAGEDFVFFRDLLRVFPVEGGVASVVLLSGIESLVGFGEAFLGAVGAFSS